jgi:hypothetical protein
VDFTGGLAGNASTYFSLEGALTTADVSAAGQGHLSDLQVKLSKKDVPLATDPDTAAVIDLQVRVTHGDGSPAAGALIEKTRNGKTVRFTANNAGILHLYQPVTVNVPPRVDVRATSATGTGSASAVLYSLTRGPVCHLDGRPDKLTPLRHLLDLVGVPSVAPKFDGWIQAAVFGTSAIPNRYETTLSGETFSGSGIRPLYELRISVRDLKSKKVVSTSDLYSRKRALLNPLTGNGLAPLQAFARRMNCSSNIIA